MSPEEDLCQLGIEFGVVFNPRILLLLFFRRVRFRVSEARCWAQQQGGERWGTPRISSACRNLRRWEGASRNGKLPRMHSKSLMVFPERYVIRWHVSYFLLCDFLFLFLFLFVLTSQGGLCNESLYEHVSRSMRSLVDCLLLCQLWTRWIWRSVQSQRRR